MKKTRYFLDYYVLVRFSSGDQHLFHYSDGFLAADDEEAKKKARAMKRVLVKKYDTDDKDASEYSLRKTIPLKKRKGS